MRSPEVNNLIQTTVTLLACLGAAISHAQGLDLELRGIRVGDKMVQCPPDSRTVKSLNPETTCSFGKTTFAAEPALDHSVSFFDGQVVAVEFSLKPGGFDGHYRVVGALKEKFGSPSTEKSHINEYTWSSGDAVLHFDGYRGHVILLSLKGMHKAQQHGAKKNKSDM